MRARAWWIALGLFGCAALFACSGDDNDDDGDGSAGSAGTAGTSGSAGSGGMLTGGTGGGSAGQGGSDDAGTEAGDAAACNGTAEALGFEADCAGCVNQTCCSEAEKCNGNANCAALLACVLECPMTDGGPEDACLQACAGDSPEGIGDYNALVLCLGTGCEACPF